MHVLVVEDDRAIGKYIQQGLTEAGHKCTLVKDGSEGLDHGLTGQFDAIVLDLLLPGVSGLDLLRRLRAAGVRTPVLAATALGSVDEKVIGLNAGADDYLVKPIIVAELLARLEAVRRRIADRPPATIDYGPLHLDLSNGRVTRDGREIDLTPTELSILELLIRYQGQTVTRKMLCQHVWDTDGEGLTNVVEVHIKRLRDKLAAAGEDHLIETVRGRGYRVLATDPKAAPPAAAAGA